MTDNQHKKNLRKKFAEYILNEIKTLADWNTDFFGEFPPKSTGMKEYFIYLVKADKEPEKIKAISDFFAFNGHTEIEKKSERVKSSGKPRTIEKFFRNEIKAPYEVTLNFVATVFGLPIKTFSEFEAQFTYATNEKVVQKISDKEQQKTVIPAKPEQPKKRINIIAATAAIMLILLAVVALKPYLNYSAMKTKFASAEKNLQDIENMAFKPEYSNSILLRDTAKTSKNVLQVASVNSASGNLSEINLFFHTNNIYNHKFIYSTKPWDFTTDPKGEDMNSKYGEPFNSDIIKLKPVDNDFATLANEYIWIRFDLQNDTDFPLYVDNLKVKVIAVHNINSKTMHYNVWMPELTELKHKITLKDKIETYPIATFVEIPAQKSQHFSLEVKGEKSCYQKIYKFRVFASCNDGKGNRKTIQSDKDYFVGFLPALPDNK